MRNILTVFALTVFGSGLFSQTSGESDSPVVSPCHTYEMQDAHFEAHPELLDQAESAKSELAAFTAEFISEPRSKSDDHLIIPVVFHVVHLNGTENISDAQVEDCIRVLIEDFNADNNELNFVNSNFEPIIGNVGVEFRLAQHDPEGNCTNGIIRTVHNSTNAGGENLKQVSPSWGRDKYLNVWVCRTIASGAAGYAFNPFSVSGADGEAMDGIVVRSDYVGSIGTSSVGRSHTMSHEVAHWINIAHVWGATNEPNVEGNCEIDDFVADTPNSIGWTSCNTLGESCGVLNNVENFMEYSGCGRMFTEGQAAVMQASLNFTTASRSNLWQQENLEATGVLGPGILCLAEFKSNSTPLICPGGTLEFTDMSYNGITEFLWTFEGGEPATSTDPNPQVVWNTPGKYDITLQVGNASGTISTSKSEYVTVLDYGQVQIPLIEGFEGYWSLEDDNSNWTVLDAIGNSETWKLTSDAAFTDYHSVMVEGRNNPDNARSYLISPTIDLTGVSESAVLRFKYAHANRIQASNDELRVWASSDCGETWSLRKTITGNNLPTVQGNVTSSFIPESLDDWEEVEISNIISTFFQESFLLRFEFKSYRGNNIYIDDINLNDLQFVSTGEIRGLNHLRLFPNPSTAETSLTFSLDRSTRVDIEVLDLTGRVVKSVYTGQMAAGDQIHRFDVSNMAQGIYLVRMVAGDEQVLRKVVVSK